MKYTAYGSGRTICFGALQLDPTTPKIRRQCLKKFFQTADMKVNWTSSCDVHYLFGDFNFRTGKQSKDGDQNTTMEVVHHNIVGPLLILYRFCYLFLFPENISTYSGAFSERFLIISQILGFFSKKERRMALAPP